jgi:IS1 family transposase
MSDMNRLDTARRAHVLKCLAEGVSLRGTARLTGVARMTIEKLLRDLGAACAAYQDKALRDLNSTRVQCDEIWSFCYAKKKNVTYDMQQEHPDAGDVWTWTAIDADSKLVLTWRVSGRSNSDAYDFMADLQSRLSGRVQLTTDGLRAYVGAVDAHFGVDVDFATLAKIYKNTTDAGKYSPAECIGCEKNIISGDPDPAHISTSYVERQNLTMRMHMRRFTRLTNGFSKQVENHAHAVALHFMWYNFVKIHGSLRITPAMAAGVTDRVWEAEDVVALLD